MVGEVGRGGEKTGETSATSCDEYGGSSSGSVGVVDASLAALSLALSLWSAGNLKVSDESRGLAPSNPYQILAVLFPCWLATQPNGQRVAATTAELILAPIDAAPRSLSRQSINFHSKRRNLTPGGRRSWRIQDDYRRICATPLRHPRGREPR